MKLQPGLRVTERQKGEFLSRVVKGQDDHHGKQHPTAEIGVVGQQATELRMKHQRQRTDHAQKNDPDEELVAKPGRNPGELKIGEREGELISVFRSRFSTSQPIALVNSASIT